MVDILTSLLTKVEKAADKTLINERDTFAFFMKFAGENGFCGGSSWDITNYCYINSLMVNLFDDSVENSRKNIMESLSLNRNVEFDGLVLHVRPLSPGGMGNATEFAYEIHKVIK